MRPGTLIQKRLHTQPHTYRAPTMTTVNPNPADVLNLSFGARVRSELPLADLLERDSPEPHQYAP